MQVLRARTRMCICMVVVVVEVVVVCVCVCGGGGVEGVCVHAREQDMSRAQIKTLLH